MARIVTRSMLRGKPLDDICKKANVDREFQLCYCYGMSEDSYYFRECKECGAYSGNTPMFWDKGFCPNCVKETFQDRGFCAECGEKLGEAS